MRREAALDVESICYFPPSPLVKKAANGVAG